MSRLILPLQRIGPLAYPGRQPGFDPSHFASKNVRLSAVASGNNFVNLLNAKKGTVTGAVTAIVDSRIGPAAQITTIAGSDTYVSIPSPSNAAIPTSATVASIFTYGTNGNFSGLFGSNQTTFGVMFGVQAAGGSIQCYNGTVLNSVACVPVAGNAYFAAVSYNTTKANFVLVNLTTGQVFSDSVTGASATAAADGTYCLGVNNNFSTNSLVGGLAAGMYAAEYLSIPQLLQWARDPWAFWYPRTLDLADMLGTSAAPGGSVGTSAGAGVASGVGASTAASTGTSTGAGAASGVGASVAAAAGTAAGAGTASGTDSSVDASTGSSSGQGTATGVGQSTAASVGSSAGAGTANGVGSSAATAVGTSAGAGSASGVGISTATAVGTSAGIGTASAVANTGASVGLSSGAGAATGVGASTAASVGTSSGVGATAGVGASTAAATGTSAGTGAATGVGASTAASVGSSAGAGAATGVGTFTSGSVGTTAGAGVATGVGASIFSAVGQSSGLATVVGIALNSGGGADTRDGVFTKKQLYEFRKRQKQLAGEREKLLAEPETRRKAIRAEIQNVIAPKQKPVEQPIIAKTIEPVLETIQPKSVILAVNTEIEEEDEEIMLILSEIL